MRTTTMLPERKTISVQALRRAANFKLENDESLTEDARKGICSLIEHALQQANAYRGFRYVDGWPQAEGKTEFKRHYL